MRWLVSLLVLLSSAAPSPSTTKHITGPRSPFGGFDTDYYDTTPKLETNAMRFARGLPPLPPRKKKSNVRFFFPSPLTTIQTHTHLPTATLPRAALYPRFSSLSTSQMGEPNMFGSIRTVTGQSNALLNVAVRLPCNTHPIAFPANISSYTPPVLARRAVGSLVPPASLFIATTLHPFPTFQSCLHSHISCSTTVCPHVLRISARYPSQHRPRPTVHTVLVWLTP